MAADYFTEIARCFSGATAAATELAEVYREVSDCLRKASGKSLGTEEKVAILERARRLETEAQPAIKELSGAVAGSG